MVKYKQSMKPLLIGTALLVVMVTSYSVMSPNQVAKMIPDPAKADPLEPFLRTGENGYQNNTHHEYVIKRGAFIHSQEAIQKRRRDRISEVCERYPMTSQDDVINKPPFNIIVDHDHKLLFCFIPKVACTSWKRIFLVLKGVISRTDDINQFAINHREQRNLNFFSRQSRRMRERILRSYTKIMFARHPMSRVLSAYKNKLAPDTTFNRARRWQKTIGEGIFEHFHPDSTNNDYSLTFADFVKFLGEEGNLRGKDDKHWMEMYKMCSPCGINYDIIGKFETMSTDAEFVLESLSLSNAVEFPSSTGSSPTNSSDYVIPYYAQLPDDDVMKLYERYRLDFELFGYDIPHEIHAT
ncbi:carbohydrate sulfotransferase 11 isoform X3 [Strongylocentrotus purpuratus]|uniref:Carbohydrate sulfotransferase n=1 Tax=Strongylocentrotus purpuratus TaxID=7668 RepID=A0A7M7P5H8_STRPU|nr:carbohydrate sulfotransferase 11 isoform X3 [Strongylocentrotus purpuratus]XP_790895.2 carbohydrate sulfotransferase 11 isoform X3 [Strongylocentrotus purpuratus]